MRNLIDRGPLIDAVTAIAGEESDVFVLHLFAYRFVLCRERRNRNEGNGSSAQLDKVTAILVDRFHHWWVSRKLPRKLGKPSQRNLYARVPQA